MSFAWPQLLWLLLLPAALLAWEFSRRRRAAAASAHPKILRAEAGERGVAFVPSSAPISARRKIRPWLAAGLAFTIVALARPQWGRVDEPVFDQSREILLAIDLSRSMLTPDVKPSRLDRAKLLVQSLLEKLSGERVGLVVFSGTAFLQSPLSADYEILREFLPSLNPDFLPEGGTNYRALIDTSLDAFNSSNSADRFLIILSDGEATDSDWQAGAEKLAAKGIRVIGLGVGTAAGAMIPDGTGGFVKDERGAVVLSKLESATLQELARTTHGVYRDASTWVDLAALLKETVEAGRKGQFVEKNTIRLVERFQWPLALGLWCLFASLCYEFPVRPRPRDLALRVNETGNRKPETGKIAAAVVVLVLVSGLRFPVSGFAAATLAPAKPDTPSIARTVGRIANATAPNARDWAELGRETAAWGTQLQSEQQPVPEGPVRDALAAADLGAKLDRQAADWSKLREQLEALLKKPEDQKQPPQQQQNQDKNQPQQNQDRQKSDPQKSDQQKQNQSPPDQKQSGADQQQKQSAANPPQQDQNQKPENQNKKSDESAFGNMKEKSEPPPPPTDMQKVGGAPDKPEQPKENADPALAIPLQKLDQLRNQDSPARLFELMEPDKKAPAPKSGKNW